MASATATGRAAPPERHRTPAGCAHLLAHIDVLVDRRRLGPMGFEDAVAMTHELVRQGVPLSQIRLVHARHPHPPEATLDAPHDGAGTTAS